MAAFNGNEPFGSIGAKTRVNSFTEQDWDHLLAQLELVIGEPARALRDNRVAKLSAAIAYLAGSEDADRYALGNLLVYHAATRAHAVFDHRPSDDQDLFRRLGAYRFGRQADEKTVRYGLNLLARVMVNDHAHDLADDAAAGKYNPVGSGAWDASALQRRLDTEMAKDLPNGALFKPFQDVSTFSWWQA